MEDLKNIIRDIPDFPKKGILFKDITTLLGDAKSFTRMVDLLAHRYVGEKIDKVSGNKVKRSCTVKVGVEIELAKKIVKLLKESKMKVQASIQGDTVRVTGKNRDDLQAAIAFIKKSITDFPLQYQNFRD